MASVKLDQSLATFYKKFKQSFISRFISTYSISSKRFGKVFLYRLILVLLVVEVFK